MVEPPPNSLHPRTRAAWRTWLEENHSRTEGVWLISYKKTSPYPNDISYYEALDEALCFGWIDSTARTVDAERAMRYYSPRRQGSNWSALNKARVEKLIAQGLMTAAGMAKIEAAKLDGTWTALDGVEAGEIPPDLSAAFDQYPPARENFATFPRSVKRSILEWILNAKQPATRQKRILETAELAAQNIRANQWRQ